MTTASNHGYPGKYFKYLVIALVLAVIAHSVNIYLLQRAAIIQDQVQELQTNAALLEQKVNFYTMLASKNNNNNNNNSSR